MAWWQWLLGILMFFVALGVLVGIHELGHLCMAKLFHVYCFNYSIGFGPKLISSKRTDKHETIWTLRAIPLGGFVSMYGEGAELDDGVYIPPSRSLEGVARHKRAIIVSAGVILNTVLGFVLMTFSNLGVQTRFNFVNPSDKYEACIILSTTDNKLGIKTNDALQAIQDPVSGEFILQKDPHLVNEETSYIFTFSNSLNYTNKDPLLSDSIVMYKAIKIPKAIENGVKYFSDDTKFGFIAGQNRADVLAPLIYSNEKIPSTDTAKRKQIYNQMKSMNKSDQVKRYEEELTKAFKNRGLNEYSIDTTSSYKVDENAKHFEVTFNTYKCLSYDANENKYIHDTNPTPHKVTLEPSGTKWKDNIGISFKRYQYRYDAGKVFSLAWDKWKTANTAIIRGLGGLFTGRAQVSGIVGIAKTSATTLANFGFAQYLYLWGMISCNLALINLLPIPGLDGWALLVTAYEGVRKKQINTKVKNIISFIGLAFLFTLMIVIIVKDIIGLIV